MNLAKTFAISDIILRGHILNWFWRKHELHHDVRGEVLADVITKYLKRYLPAAAGVIEEKPVKNDKKEKIFTIWLQGEDDAPALVKACFRSIRRHCKQELIVLDATTIFDYISLPKEIIKKYKAGKIKSAHFADICRVELLYEHGGIWMDSTCFATDPIPDWVIDQDFFVYMYDQGYYKYSFMQNCFIRARKGAYLLAAWRAMILDYWLHENTVMDYFVHQLMFKTLVQNDPRAIQYFAEMPHVDQTPTHAVWWKYGDKPFNKKLFDQLISGAFWQKTTYKSSFAKEPISGTFADYIINKA